MLDAVTFAFSYPDNSRDRRLLAAKPVHRDEGPFVEVELTTGPYHLVFSKRWLKRAATSLHVIAPRPENLTGRQAHDRLEAILDETLDRTLLSALHYQQGVTIQQAALAESSSLSAALDAATTCAGSLRGENEESLWDRVCGERLRYFTETGRPLQYRKDIEERRGRAEESFAALEKQVAEIEGDADAQYRKSESSRELEQQLDAERPKKDKAEAVWRAAEKLVTATERLDAEHRLAVANAEAARNQVSTREQLLHDVEEAGLSLDKLRQTLAQQAPAIAAAEEALTRASGARDLAREEQARAERHADLANADEQYWRTRSNQAMYLNRQATVERAQVALQEARRTLDACQLDENLMEQLEAAHEARTMADARLHAAQASLTIEALSPIDLTSSGRTQPLASGERFETPVATSGEVVIEGVARVLVAGAASDRRLEKKLRAEAESFADLLVAAGLRRDDGIDAARALDRERRRAVEQERSSEEQIRVALHDLPGVEELERRITTGEEQMETHLANRVDQPPLPQDKESAEQETASAADALRTARIAERECDGVFAELDRARGKLVGTSYELRDKLDAAESRLEETESALQIARAGTPDEALAEAVAVAEETEAVACDALEAAREELEQAAPERARLDHENQVALLQRLENESSELHHELAILTGRLELAGEQSLQEALDQAREELDLTTAEAVKTSRLAAAAEQLWEIMGRKRDEARRAYVAPYREALQRLARLVFGRDVVVEVDERSLQVTERTLAARTVRFDQLSTGTQEQLCVLARLACAMIVSPTAEDAGAPVILDDALGYTDHERLGSMTLALSAAREGCQVVLLTCVPERYGRIGPARVVRFDEKVRSASP